MHWDGHERTGASPVFPVYIPARIHEYSGRIVDRESFRDGNSLGWPSIAPLDTLQNEIESIRVGSRVQRAKEFINSDGRLGLCSHWGVTIPPRFLFSKRIQFLDISLGKSSDFRDVPPDTDYVSEDNRGVTWDETPFSNGKWKWNIGFSKRFIFLYVFSYAVFCIYVNARIPHISRSSRVYKDEKRMIFK